FPSRLLLLNRLLLLLKMRHRPRLLFLLLNLVGLIQVKSGSLFGMEHSIYLKQTQYLAVGLRLLPIHTINTDLQNIILRLNGTIYITKHIMSTSTILPQPAYLD